MIRGLSPAATSYSRVIGLVYIFNLIVGTGVLTMPKAFQMAGWITGFVVVYILAFMGYITATFLVEAMSIANGLIKLQLQNPSTPRHIVDLFDSSTSSHSSASALVGWTPGVVNDLTPLLDFRYLSDSGEDTFPFEITKRFELTEMAGMFFPPVGLSLVYLSFCIYLYGDLAVYAAAVPKSLRDLVCNFQPFNNDTNPVHDEAPCLYWYPSFTRHHAYWTCLAGFAILLGPFAFFNVTRTKYLQIIATFLRWFSLVLMLILCLIGFVRSSPPFDAPHPPLFNPRHIPTLFGVTIYAFMWHHSLPSLVTPIRKKRGLQLLILADITIILSFYLLVSITAVYSFPHLKDLYTLNFIPDTRDSGESSRVPQIPALGTFLVTYPIFTLSTTFPIVAITLRENLKVLISQLISLYQGRPLVQIAQHEDLLLNTNRALLSRLFYGFLAIGPPFLVAFWVNDITTLVNFTGSYSGAAIQYVIPALLVWYARRHLHNTFHEHTLLTLRMHRSPFQHVAFIIGILIWTIILAILVSVHMFLKL